MRAFVLVLAVLGCLKVAVADVDPTCGGDSQPCCEPPDGKDCKCDEGWTLHTFLMPGESDIGRICSAECGEGPAACTGEAKEVFDVTTFLTTMMDIAMPENLADDYEANPDLDYKGVRLANMAKASKACTSMISVRSCTAPAAPVGDKHDVCIEGEKQYFGLPTPVSKYPAGGVHNAPAVQPDGVWVFANGTCLPEEWAGGYDGFWDSRAWSGHEPGITEAVRQMLKSPESAGKPVDAMAPMVEEEVEPVAAVVPPVATVVPPVEAPADAMAPLLPGGDIVSTGAATYMAVVGQDYNPKGPVPKLVAVEDIMPPGVAGNTVADQQECEDACTTTLGCNAASFYLNATEYDDKNCWLKKMADSCELPSDADMDPNAVLLLKVEDTCAGIVTELAPESVAMAPVPAAAPLTAEAPVAAVAPMAAVAPVGFPPVGVSPAVALEPAGIEDDVAATPRDTFVESDEATRTTLPPSGVAASNTSSAPEFSPTTSTTNDVANFHGALIALAITAGAATLL